MKDVRMGAVWLENGSVHFSLKSLNASSVCLVLFSPNDFVAGKITLEIPLGGTSGENPFYSEDVWRCTVSNLPFLCLAIMTSAVPLSGAPSSPWVIP